MNQKRVVIRLTDEIHMKFMLWCRKNGTTAQVVGENLIKGIMEAQDEEMIKRFTEKAG